MGGGVLSIPLAFAKAGIGLGTALMVFSAIITDFSLYLLCCCARRTGAASYIDVVRFAFGPMAEICITGILWFFLSGVLVAFNVLLMGIFAPLARDFVTTFTSIDMTVIDEKQFDILVLLAIIVLISPLMLQKNLYALRHICYVGFTSVCVIAVSIGYRAYQRITIDIVGVIPAGLIGTDMQIKFMTDDWMDALHAFPIIVLAFMCSFNVVEVQGALENPTRERVKSVIHISVTSCFVLFQLFGLAGYFYAYDACRGNIFLNFDPSDSLIIVGRLGMGLTLMFGTPVVTLPCREACLSLISQIQSRWRDSQDSAILEKQSELDGLVDTAHTTLLNSNMDSYSSFTPGEVEIDEGICDISAGICDISAEFSNPVEEDIRQDHNMLAHVGITFMIASFAFLGAVSVPGVEFVWSILGSSLGMLIGFIIPSACYLKIRGGKGMGRNTNIGAFALLVFSILVAVACTIGGLSS